MGKMPARAGIFPILNVGRYTYGFPSCMLWAHSPVPLIPDDRGDNHPHYTEEHNPGDGEGKHFHDVSEDLHQASTRFPGSH